MATDIVKKLREKPNNDELLSLYGLYKQAILGDNTTEEPGMLSFNKKYKWASWNSNKGKSKEKAEYEYIILVNQLIKKYKIKKN